ncbi:MAG: hypothetical protein H6822_11485 [Planctomycetaceae bacterium]|nr:hypothetical protein [Planctomycetales bacterium]MCB9922797.1 hypothetical protein [Planctomycetaceae bacterium]
MIGYFLRRFGRGRLPTEGYQQIEPDSDPVIAESIVVSVSPSTNPHVALA